MHCVQSAGGCPAQPAHRSTQAAQHVKVPPPSPSDILGDCWLWAQRGANPPGAAVPPRRDHCHQSDPA